jgi:hypothetical protein
MRIRHRKEIRRCVSQKKLNSLCRTHLRIPFWERKHATFGPTSIQAWNRSNNENEKMCCATKCVKRTKDGRQTDGCYYLVIYPHLELDHARTVVADLDPDTGSITLESELGLDGFGACEAHLVNCSEFSTRCIAVSFPLAASQKIVPPRNFWVVTSFPRAENWRPRRGDSYWSEKMRSPGASLFLERTPPGFLTMVAPSLGVRSCLPSWQAAHFGGRTVVELILMPSWPMSPHRPSHCVCCHPRWPHLVCQRKRRFWRDDRLSLRASAWAVLRIL